MAEGTDLARIIHWEMITSDLGFGEVDSEGKTKNKEALLILRLSSDYFTPCSRSFTGSPFPTN